MFEGIPGSGKTTTSQLTYKHLIENGIESRIYIEGSVHPIDLPYFAYLSYSEYEVLLQKYKRQAEWLQQTSIFEDDYVLTPYKIPEPYPFDDILVEYLKRREFCYSGKPVVSFEMFKKVFIKRFERYVDRIINKSETTIFESVLLQHQIHDINRLYPEVSDFEIIEYLKKLANILTPLNPVLFYISQNSVKESLIQTALVRSKPKWSTEETIAYYEKRKQLELDTITHLPIQTTVLDNSDYNWERMFDEILQALALST